MTNEQLNDAARTYVEANDAVTNATRGYEQAATDLENAKSKVAMCQIELLKSVGSNISKLAAVVGNKVVVIRFGFDDKSTIEVLETG